MIEKIIYYLLSQDETDILESDALAQVQIKHPQITTIEGLNHKWKSLKTLLTDTSPNWAINKIKYSSFSEESDNEIISNSSLPILIIENITPLVLLPINNGRCYQTRVKITAKSSSEQGGFLTWNLIKRVNHVLNCFNTDKNSYRKLAQELNKFGFLEISTKTIEYLNLKEDKTEIIIELKIVEY